MPKTALNTYKVKDFILHTLFPTNSKKLVITGATGFIGNHFINDSKEYAITPISLRTQRPQDLTLTDYDAVIHFAALVHQMQGAPKEEYLSINRDLTLSFAQKAKDAGVSHFIFISTIKVYGEETTITPLNETTACHPLDPYGNSKLAAEEGLLKLASEDFTVSIVRIPLVYGEGVKANMLNLIKLCNSLSFLPFGGIHNKRSILYVKNLTAFIKILLEQRKFGIFIVSDATPISTTDLIKTIGSALEKKLFLFPLPLFVINLLQRIKPSLHQRLFNSLEINPSESFNKLSFTPPFTTQEGINAMIKWYNND